MVANVSALAIGADELEEGLRGRYHGAVRLVIAPAGKGKAPAVVTISSVSGGSVLPALTAPSSRPRTLHRSGLSLAAGANSVSPGNTYNFGRRRGTRIETGNPDFWVALGMNPGPDGNTAGRWPTRRVRASPAADFISGNLVDDSARVCSYKLVSSGGLVRARAAHRDML